jgi:hypothetical protein
MGHIAVKAALRGLSFSGIMTARVSFKQDDVARAVKGALSGGIRVARVEISPTDGRIVIVAEIPNTCRRTKTNPWDSEFEEA